MSVHQIYALVDKTGLIRSVSCWSNYQEASEVAICVYGNEALAVDCECYPCQEGDRYHDGRFWSPQEDGTEMAIEYIPTPEQEVRRLSAENVQLRAESNELTLALAEMIGGGADVE